MLIKFWGTRGSIPTPASDYSEYGANTSCVTVQTSDQHELVLDAGSGLHWWGKSLLNAGFASGTGRASVLLTHTHWDHIQGIPFCYPMLISGNHFFFSGDSGNASSLRDLLLHQMDRVYCPVPNFLTDISGSTVQVQDLCSSEFEVGNTRIVARRVNHLQGAICLGYRLETAATSIAYIPDVEYLEEAHHEPVVELAHDVDLLIHGAYFTASEYPNHQGEGHGSDADAVAVAIQAGASRLLLSHHHPDRDDRGVTAMVAKHAEAPLPVSGAREGSEYNLGV